MRFNTIATWAWEAPHTSISNTKEKHGRFYLLSGDLAIVYTQMVSFSYSSIALSGSPMLKPKQSYGQSVVSLQICTETQVKSHNTLPILTQQRKSTDSIQSPTVTPGALPSRGSKDKGNDVSTGPGGSKDRWRRQAQSNHSSNCLSASPKKRKCYSKSKLFKRKHKLNSCSLPSQKDISGSYLNTSNR